MKTIARKRLILIELNEINLDLALAYAERRSLVNLTELINNSLRTDSEARYEDLEPWIQWVSVHSGKTAQEHGIFRLGDIVGSDIPQFFEKIEEGGYTVGAVSAMNAENRLRNPAYFIPDPWTKTHTDGSFWSNLLGEAVSQAVNDNSKASISAKSIFSLIGGLIRFARPANFQKYFSLARRSRGASWRKALFLDLFLHDLHLDLFRNKRPNFSTVFLNAGAHIQHHYLLNARDAVKSELRNPAWYVAETDDPFGEMLEIYDSILGDYMAMKDVDLIIATGLSQKLYDKVKYYWRLRDHASFLDDVGIDYLAIHPRMTRDFVIEFKSVEATKRAAEKLSAMVCEHDGQNIFGDIDNRGLSLFVTLTYPAQIEGELLVKNGLTNFDLKSYVAFVAIKNGMHDPRGFVYYKGGVADYAARDGAHLSELHNVVMQYFGLEEKRSLPGQLVKVPTRVESSLAEIV